MEVQNTDSVTIYWNPPHWDLDSIQYYKLFYHPSKDTNWILIKDSIPASLNPYTVVHRNNIVAMDSIFYFGAKYVTVDGIESGLLSTTDSAAVPSGGWFLLWIKKN